MPSTYTRPAVSPQPFVLGENALETGTANQTRLCGGPVDDATCAEAVKRANVPMWQGRPALAASFLPPLCVTRTAPRPPPHRSAHFGASLPTPSRLESPP